MTEDDLRELEGNQRRANPHRLDCTCASCQEQSAEKVRHILSAERTALRLEADIERDCTNILIQDGWDALKTNPVSRRSRGAGFGTLGMTDHEFRRPAFTARYTMAHEGPTIAIHALCELLFVEWKSEDGENARHQIEWQDNMRRKGFLVIAAKRDFPATVEGFCNWYENSGLKRG